MNASNTDLFSNESRPSAAGIRLFLCRIVPALWLAVAVAAQAAADGAALEQGFRRPPEETKPWCYWYWISDNISKEGITRDLEAMARAGIGEALIGNIFLDNIPAGKTKVLTEEWWQLVEHTIREGGRTGVNIGLFNCPGWSQSGGPWVKAEQSMRYLVSSETRVKGPVRFEQKLPVPKEPFQDVALLAFPAPQGDAGAPSAHPPKLVCRPAAEGAEKMTDGNTETAAVFPAGAGQGNDVFEIGLEWAEPFTARSLALTPGDTPWAARCELQAAQGDGSFTPVKTFKFDRSNMAVGVGPMPRGAVMVSFPPVTAGRFRLLLSGVTGKPALAEIHLSPAARLESFVEKQLGKMHPTPLPMGDAYLWPPSVEPESAGLLLSTNAVVNLSAQLSADGTLKWDAPPGDWILLRTGMTPTGTSNSPASPEGQGFEIDKMNRGIAKMHFDSFVGQVLKRMPAADRKAFKRVVADSYEMGSQNWTDGFGETFRQRYGYDPVPWLPVLSGRIVGGAEQSDRFLWDLRRLVADHVAKDYVGGLRDACRPHGLELWLENYGHWGFPGEFLQYGGQSDRIGGEYWVTGDLGSIECRAASSCANTYGKPIVSAEAFTGGPAFQTVPSSMKARGDWSFCEGINHFVLHVYIQQPWEDRVPGVNAWFGTEFNRHNTWFDAGRPWMDYLRRCCFLLQQGNRVADAAYFIGEDTPKMTGVRKPELPAGHDFDYINAEVILEKSAARNGLLTLPHGTAYRVLVLPELATMRPEVLRKIRDLVRDGAVVLGPPPSRSPSLENFPQCDAEVRQLASELWGTDAQALRGSGGRSFGKGRIVWNQTLETVFAELNVGPDFQSDTKLRFTHRLADGTHLYFVANPEARALTTTAAFRADGKAPELWWPDSGRMERPAVYDMADGVTRLPLHLGPHGSVFVVFREPASARRVVAVSRSGETLLGTTLKPASEPEPASGGKAPADTFTLMGWVKPSADTTLFEETNQGVRGLSEPRNDALFPPHGSAFGDSGHAGCGVAAGRNGICVFEHGAGYFAPVLVHAAPVTNWTHVAVAYRDGQPSLFLDGRFVHTGLKSRFTVHPGSGRGGGNHAFQGGQSDFEFLPRPLAEAEIVRWMKDHPHPGTAASGQPVELIRNAKGDVEAWVREAGIYELAFADGSKRRVHAPKLPEPLALEGAWEVSFDSKWGGPEKVRFEMLQDWTVRPEEGIRHYSGKAVYRKMFVWKPDAAVSARPSRLFLDLGNIRDLAAVRLNGKDLGTLWLAPWTVDVTESLRSGFNNLEIEVVNPWNNRLVGDLKLPEGQRRTFLLAPTVKKDAPLMPAGLLGPVTLRVAQRMEVD